MAPGRRQGHLCWWPLIYNCSFLELKMFINKIYKIFRSLYRLTTSFLIAFLVFHFLSIAPLANFLCLCPEKDPNWKCTCNCSKCVKGRQAKTVSLQIFHAKDPQKGTISCSKGKSCKANNPSAAIGLMPAMPVASGSCNCRKHTEDLSKDVKPFIPKFISLDTPDKLEQIIYPPETILISEYYPHPDEHPG